MANKKTKGRKKHRCGSCGKFLARKSAMCDCQVSSRSAFGIVNRGVGGVATLGCRS